MGNAGSFESFGDSELDKQLMESGGYSGIWASLTESQTQLVNSIIRPPRVIYFDEDLGPTHFVSNNRQVSRKEFQFRNNGGSLLMGSMWTFDDLEENKQRGPLIIYLHGYSSCRVEVFQVLSMLLACGIQVFSFDFSGCGMSGGDYQSLGFFERDDLFAAVDLMRVQKTVSSLCLWGRDIGAVVTAMFTSQYGFARHLSIKIDEPGITGLQFTENSRENSFFIKEVQQTSNASIVKLLSILQPGDRLLGKDEVVLDQKNTTINQLTSSIDVVRPVTLTFETYNNISDEFLQSISCIALDCPFAEMRTLSKDILNKLREDGLDLPNFVLKSLRRILRNTIKSEAGFDPFDVAPLQSVANSVVPAVFLVARNDPIFPAQQGFDLFGAYGCTTKKLVQMEFQTDNTRPKAALKETLAFVLVQLSLKDAYFGEQLNNLMSRNSSDKTDSVMNNFELNEIQLQNYIEQIINIPLPWLLSRVVTQTKNLLTQHQRHTTRRNDINSTNNLDVMKQTINTCETKHTEEDEGKSSHSGDSKDDHDYDDDVLDQCEILDLSVVGNRIQKGMNGQFTTYEIRVQAKYLDTNIETSEDSKEKENEFWYTIERRYSEFKRLHAILKKSFPKISFPEFPKGGFEAFTTRFDQNRITTRQQAFNQFLQVCKQNDSMLSSPALRLFLQPH